MRDIQSELVEHCLEAIRGGVSDAEKYLDQLVVGMSRSRYNSVLLKVIKESQESIIAAIDNYNSCDGALKGVYNAAIARESAFGHWLNSKTYHFAED